MRKGNDSRPYERQFSKAMLLLTASRNPNTSARDVKYYERSEPMPMSSVIILSLICFLFIGFGVVLAWADYQTRDIARPSREGAATGAHRAQAQAGTESIAASERSKSFAKAA
jgi:hypothetical protein